MLAAARRIGYLPYLDMAGDTIIYGTGTKIGYEASRPFGGQGVENQSSFPAVGRAEKRRGPVLGGDRCNLTDKIREINSAVITSS